MIINVVVGFQCFLSAVIMFASGSLAELFAVKPGEIPDFIARLTHAEPSAPTPIPTPPTSAPQSDRKLARKTNFNQAIAVGGSNRNANNNDDQTEGNQNQNNLDFQSGPVPPVLINERAQLFIDDVANLEDSLEPVPRRCKYTTET